MIFLYKFPKCQKLLICEQKNTGWYLKYFTEIKELY